MKNNVLVVVDDDKISRMLPGFLLRPYGITVLECDNGQEALELIETQQVNCMLIDVSMPKFDGADLVSSILKHPKYSTINLIAYTADDHFSRNDCFKKNGFHQVIVKPVSAFDLLNILNSSVS